MDLKNMKKVLDLQSLEQVQGGMMAWSTMSENCGTVGANEWSTKSNGCRTRVAL